MTVLANFWNVDVVPFEPTEELDELPPIPLESPITSLRVRLESLPEEVPAGEDLVFVAVLENPTDEDVVLNPCPAYSINYGESAGGVSTGLMLLNCDDGDHIPAGGRCRSRCASPPHLTRSNRAKVTRWSGGWHQT